MIYDYYILDFSVKIVVLELFYRVSCSSLRLLEAILMDLLVLTFIMFYFLKVINYLVSCRKQFFFDFETAKQLLQNVSFHKEIRHAKSQSQIG